MREELSFLLHLFARSKARLRERKIEEQQVCLYLIKQHRANNARAMSLCSDCRGETHCWCRRNLDETLAIYRESLVNKWQLCLAFWRALCAECVCLLLRTRYTRILYVYTYIICMYRDTNRRAFCNRYVYARDLILMAVLASRATINYRLVRSMKKNNNNKLEAFLPLRQTRAIIIWLMQYKHVKCWTQKEPLYCTCWSLFDRLKMIGDKKTFFHFCASTLIIIINYRACCCNLFVQ